MLRIFNEPSLFKVEAEVLKKIIADFYSSYIQNLDDANRNILLKNLIRNLSQVRIAILYNICVNMYKVYHEFL